MLACPYRTMLTVTATKLETATPKTPASIVLLLWWCLQTEHSMWPIWETSVSGPYVETNHPQVEDVSTGKPFSFLVLKVQCCLSSHSCSFRFPGFWSQFLWSSFSGDSGTLRVWLEWNSSVHNVARHRRLQVQLQLQVSSWSYTVKRLEFAQMYYKKTIIKIRLVMGNQKSYVLASKYSLNFSKRNLKNPIENDLRS